MGTNLRAEISKSNVYWIEQHRYYELKHFCLQYPIWKRAYASIDGLNRSHSGFEMIRTGNEKSDLTARCAEARLYYAERMALVEQAAINADEELANYILRGVTEGVSYTYLKARLEIPCCKDTYYKSYRRFFWLLNKTRN